jgi:hypothetical protein
MLAQPQGNTNPAQTQKHSSLSDGHVLNTLFNLYAEHAYQWVYQARFAQIISSGTNHSQTHSHLPVLPGQQLLLCSIHAKAFNNIGRSSSAHTTLQFASRLPGAPHPSL